MASHEATTTRQNQVLEFIMASVRDFGFPPSVREIMHAIGVKSPNSVFGHLAALKRKGAIDYGGEMRGRSRAIKILVGERCPHCMGLGRTKEA